jgi:hypothetical protein
MTNKTTNNLIVPKKDVLASKESSRYLEAAMAAPASKARSLYIQYMSGDISPTSRQACIMACGMCMGWYMDGRQDCEAEWCPCYKFMPYSKYRKIRLQGKNKSALGAGAIPNSGGSPGPVEETSQGAICPQCGGVTGNYHCTSCDQRGI